MIEEYEQVPAGVDTRVPSVARIYDYFLGGKDSFAVDREIARQLVDIAPDVPAMARDNRAFLGRVVRFLAERGIRQFIDVGTGLPTQDNVHQVAQRIAPDARVVYVDNDPIVLAHARALLADNPGTIVINADLRWPDELLADEDLGRHIDFDQPVALLLVGILYFLSDVERPFEVVARLREAVPSGSYLAISHVVSDDRPEELTRAQEVYRSFLRRTGDARRTREQVRTFFDDLDLVDPGLVDVCQWHPDGDEPVDAGVPGWMIGGVARKA